MAMEVSSGRITKSCSVLESAQVDWSQLAKFPPPLYTGLVHRTIPRPSKCHRPIQATLAAAGAPAQQLALYYYGAVTEEVQKELQHLCLLSQAAPLTAPPPRTILQPRFVEHTLVPSLNDSATKGPVSEAGLQLSVHLLVPTPPRWTVVQLRTSRCKRGCSHLYEPPCFPCTSPSQLLRQA
jgi:hypothetical protein